MDSLLSDYAANAGSAANEADYWNLNDICPIRSTSCPRGGERSLNCQKLEGKSYREIAALLNISENTVDMQMRSANSAISSGH
jgi:hypothetical protein